MPCLCYSYAIVTPQFKAHSKETAVAYLISLLVFFIQPSTGAEVGSYDLALVC